MLELRIVLGFGVSRLDYVLDVVPMSEARLRGCQRAVDKALLASLKLTRSSPRILLYVPLAAGGFGFPHLLDGGAERQVTGILRALCSRVSLARGLSRWLLRPARRAVSRRG